MYNEVNIWGKALYTQIAGLWIDLFRVHRRRKSNKYLILIICIANLNFKLFNYMKFLLFWQKKSPKGYGNPFRSVALSNIYKEVLWAHEIHIMWALGIYLINCYTICIIPRPGYWHGCNICQCYPCRSRAIWRQTDCSIMSVSHTPN